MKIPGIYLFRILEYVRYYLRADTVYSIDSPFLYSFFQKVLDDKRRFYAFGQIAALRSRLKNDHTVILKNDLGAGKSKKQTTISEMTRASGTPEFKGELLFKIVAWFKPKEILELGTNLGLSASYLASVDSRIKLFTLEGDKEILKKAISNFRLLKLNNILTVEGSFEDELNNHLNNNKFQMVYIDGNHTYDATICYFNTFIKYLEGEFLIVLDDIYWSREMKKAWNEIQGDSSCNLYLDLYHLGIVGNINSLKSPINKTLIQSSFKILKPGIFRQTN